MLPRTENNSAEGSSEFFHRASVLLVNSPPEVSWAKIFVQRGSFMVLAVVVLVWVVLIVMGCSPVGKVTGSSPVGAVVVAVVVRVVPGLKVDPWDIIFLQ